MTPSISILAQPSVAIVDSVVDKKGTREVATEYLNYLYSDEAQRIAGDNYYRPSNEDILKEYADVFDLNVNLVTILEDGKKLRKHILQMAVCLTRFMKNKK